eukprot:COSAG01_NODE_42895_length_435_cov_1.327381_1_plen_48_part_10
MYPAGSAYDFSFENATDPASWPNPSDVEFVCTRVFPPASPLPPVPLLT